MSVRALLEKFGSQLSFSWYHPPKQGDWRGSFSFISLLQSYCISYSLAIGVSLFNTSPPTWENPLAEPLVLQAEAVVLHAELMVLEAELAVIFSDQRKAIVKCWFSASFSGWRDLLRKKLCFCEKRAKIARRYVLF